MATIASATLELWIYRGAFGSKPSTPNYTITKENKTGESIIIFEIAELVRDYIEIEFTGDYNSIVQSSWVEWTLTKTLDDSSVDVTTGSRIVLDGYGYFQDEINPELPYILLQSNNKMYVKDGDLPYIPVFVDVEEGVYSIDYYKNGVLLLSETFGASLTPLTADIDTITVDTTSISADMNYLSGSGSAQYVFNATTVGNPDTVIITDVHNNTETINIEYLTECKYEPYKVSFVNKFGVIQGIYFFKRRNDSNQVTSDSYKANTLVMGTTNVSYSTSTAQNQKFNVNSKDLVTINTGFVDESFNEVIKQLLLSENVWIHENGTVYPINPKTESLTFKKSVTDKLIDYSIDFEYAFDTINNIR